MIRGRRVAVERPLELREVGDVALDAVEHLQLVVGEREAQPVVAVRQVVRDDLVPVVEQRADGPGADGAEGRRLTR